MNKLLLQGFLIILCLFLQKNVSAQDSKGCGCSDEKTESFEKLFSTVQNSGALLNKVPDLSDFNFRAQKGLDFMRPGATVQNLICTKSSDWFLSFEIEFRSYLLNLYKDYIEEMEPGWIESLFSYWKTKDSKIGLMSWEVNFNGKSQPVTSIAVFDNEWNILFDTKLIYFIADIQIVDSFENAKKEEGLIPDGSLPINSEQTGTKLISEVINSIIPGSHVTMHWKVRGRAIVSPYITAATNDAYFHFQTLSIENWRSNPSTFTPPPLGEPVLWFGKDGDYDPYYNGSEPWKSDIVLPEEDHFNDGEYHVYWFNGEIREFTFDFDVSYGPAGLNFTFLYTNPEFTLSSNDPSIIKLNNYTWAHMSSLNYWAFFSDGGSLSMDNFYIRTGSGGEEVGTVTITLPINRGYTTGPANLTPAPQCFPDDIPCTIFFRNRLDSHRLKLIVEYVRGDALEDPVYEVTSTDYSIALAEVDTIIATVYNYSERLNLEGGSVSLDVATLNDRLVLLSPGTLPVETIEEGSSKEFHFIVQGNEEGTVTPQVDFTNLRWEAPVPPHLILTGRQSISQNIVVGNPSTVENDINNIEDFALFKCYPNPFNPSTIIKYELPKANFVIIKVYDVLGNEAATLVKEEKPAGSYEVNFNASKLTSGIYFYTMQAGSFVETKKMVLLK